MGERNRAHRDFRRKFGGQIRDYNILNFKVVNNHKVYKEPYFTHNIWQKEI